MSPEANPTPGESSRLTLGQMMGAVAALAISFAMLPWVLSAPLAITILGILSLQGLRVKPLSSRGGSLPWIAWAIWVLAMVACPVAMTVIGDLFRHQGGYPAPGTPRPRAAEVVDVLCYAHLAISVIAAIVVVLLARGVYRWIAWVSILVIGFFTALAAVGATMSTTGIYL